jgi:hypothetical protein
VCDTRLDKNLKHTFTQEDKMDPVFKDGQLMLTLAPMFFKGEFRPEDVGKRWVETYVRGISCISKISTLILIDSCDASLKIILNQNNDPILLKPHQRLSFFISMVVFSTIRIEADGQFTVEHVQLKDQHKLYAIYGHRLYQNIGDRLYAYDLGMGDFVPKPYASTLICGPRKRELTKSVIEVIHENIKEAQLTLREFETAIEIGLIHDPSLTILRWQVLLNNRDFEDRLCKKYTQHIQV